MFVFVDLHKILRMQFIRMSTDCNEISHTKPRRFISHRHHTED